MSTVCGTPLYLAPEVTAAQATGSSVGYTKSVDLWSIGIILFVMLSGVSPKNAHLVGPKFPPTLFQSVSEDAKDLIRRLLTIDPALRITSLEVIRHPWMTTEIPAAYQAAVQPLLSEGGGLTGKQETEVLVGVSPVVPPEPVARAFSCGDDPKETAAAATSAAGGGDVALEPAADAPVDLTPDGLLEEDPHEVSVGGGSNGHKVMEPKLAEPTQPSSSTSAVVEPP
eukprot:RCo010796